MVLTTERLQVPFVDLAAQYATIRDEIDDAMSEVLHGTDFILGRGHRRKSSAYSRPGELSWLRHGRLPHPHWSSEQHVFSGIGSSEGNPNGRVSSMASSAATRSRGFELTDCLPSVNLLYTILWYNDCTEGLHSLCLSLQTKQVSTRAVRSDSGERNLS